MKHICYVYNNAVLVIRTFYPKTITCREEVFSKSLNCLLIKHLIKSIRTVINLSNFVGLRIRHFAGQVSYVAAGFMEKNADKVPRHISTGFYQSKLSLIQSLFPEGKWNVSPNFIRHLPNKITQQAQCLLLLIY